MFINYWHEDARQQDIFTINANIAIDIAEVTLLQCVGKSFLTSK